MKVILSFVILFLNPFPVFGELQLLNKLIPNEYPIHQGYGAGYDHPDSQHGYHNQGAHGVSAHYGDHGHRRHQPDHLGLHYNHGLLDKNSHGHNTLKENSAWNRNRGEVFVKKAIWDQDEGRRNHLADHGHQDGYHSNYGHGGKLVSHGGVDEGYSRKGGHHLFKAYNAGSYGKEKRYNNHDPIPILKHLPLVPIHEPNYNLIKHQPLIHEKIALLKPIYRPEIAYIDDNPYHNYDPHIPRPDPIVHHKPYTGHYQKHDNHYQEDIPVYRDHQPKPISHLFSPHGLLDHMPKYYQKNEYREPPIGYHEPRYHSYHHEKEEPEYHHKPIFAVKTYHEKPVYHHEKPVYHHEKPVYHHEKPYLLEKPDIYIPGVPDVIPEVKDGIYHELGNIISLGSANKIRKL